MTYDQHMALDPSQPNRIFYIVPHSDFTKEIRVIEVSTLIRHGVDDAGFEDAVQHVATKNKIPACVTVRRNNTLASEYDAFEGADTAAPALAHWRSPSLSRGNRLMFPQDSRHASHPVEIRPPGLLSSPLDFVVDSVRYSWTSESIWHYKRTDLVKSVHGVNTPVAKLLVPYRLMPIKWGGVLVLNHREVDWAIVVLSALVVLKKMRKGEWDTALG